jgi:carboxyl-terminal processing protease
MTLTRKHLVIFSTIFVILLAGSCSIGFIAGHFFPSEQVSSFLVFPGMQPNQDTFLPEGDTPEELSELFTPFWQSWNLIHNQFVDQPVDDVALMRGAIEGMFYGLGDPYSSYMNPEQLEIFETQIYGEEYEGIGAWVDISTEYLTIISPMIGSPAEEAGLKPGDLVIAIDGEDMTGIDGELVRQRVLGPAGTTVVLTILRPGLEEPFDVEVERAAIKSSYVMGQITEDNIAVVRLISFGDDQTIKDLRATLKDLLAQNPDGLVLDLRNNGGGLLNSAIDVASEFIDKGVIAYEKYGDGREDVFKAKRGGLATKIPLIVLINEGTASASEIVAGAIQDYERGLLVGSVSYGKGSVQILSELANEQGAIRITAAKWLTPNRRTIQETGLQPDVLVEMTEEDINANIDPQLDAAINLLLEQNQP